MATRRLLAADLLNPIDERRLDTAARVVGADGVARVAVLKTVEVTKRAANKLSSCNKHPLRMMLTPRLPTGGVCRVSS